MMAFDPQDYAERILNVCRWYLESPDLRGWSDWCRKLLSAGGGILAVVGLLLHAPAIRAQEATDWQAKAGAKMAFDVASVKAIPPELRHPPTFPLDNRNAFVPGGRFSATFPLWVYIKFAYKLSSSEAWSTLAHLPAWVNSYSDLFAIDARAEGNPSKDQMRLMMQSLLADRFQLVVHFETREVPVLALSLVKPGQRGPKLRPHADGPPCPDYGLPVPASPARLHEDVFPLTCDTVALLLNGTMERLGARNTDIPLLADAISETHAVNQVVVDRTGLIGTFDFTLDYTVENTSSASDSDRSTFLSALRDQLGMKLVASRAPIRGLVVDHVEKPSEN